MKYQVNYSNESRQDLRDIFTYVSEQLMAPGTAADLVNRIMDAVESMEEELSRKGRMTVDEFCNMLHRYVDEYYDSIQG